MVGQAEEMQPITPTEQQTWIIIILLCIILALLCVAGLMVLRIIGKSVSRPAPTSLIGVLTMIVVLTIAGYLGFGETRSELIALGSTALGALTATLTGMHAQARRVERLEEQERDREYDRERWEREQDEGGPNGPTLPPEDGPTQSPREDKRG